MSFAERLAQYDQAFAAAYTLGGTVPDGSYTAEIKKAFVQEDGRAEFDTLYLNVHYSTDKGMCFQNITLTNFASEKAMSFSKGQLANLGYNGPISGIENYLGNLIGASAQISVSNDTYEGKERTNVTVRKLTTPLGSVSQASPFDAFNGGQPAQQNQGMFDPATEQAFTQAGFPHPNNAPAQGQPVQQQFAAQPVQQVQQQPPMQNGAVQQQQPMQQVQQPVQNAPVDFMQPAQGQPMSPGQAIAQHDANAQAQQNNGQTAQLPFLG